MQARGRLFYFWLNKPVIVEVLRFNLRSAFTCEGRGVVGSVLGLAPGFGHREGWLEEFVGGLEYGKLVSGGLYAGGGQHGLRGHFLTLVLVTH